MVDRPPPSRFAVVEKGGRLVVIDKESGATPPTAAQRMAAHDRERGVAPIQPAPPRVPNPEVRTTPRAEPKPVPQTGADPAPAGPAPSARQPQSQIAAALAKRAQKPWANSDRPAPGPTAASRRTPTGSAGQRQTIVTGKWWDAKGPRTIELGQLGQARLRSSLWALAGAVLVAAILLLFLFPIALLAFGFILFRFGSNIFAPIGASIIDKALAEPN